MTLNSSPVSIGDTATASQYNNMRKDILQKAGDYATTGGSSTAYTLTLDSTWTLTDGIVVVAKAHVANGVSPTLNVTPSGGAATGAIALKQFNGAAPSVGAIPINSIFVARYNSSLSCFQLLVSASAINTIDTLLGGETINGGTLPVPCYIDTSDGKVYACDANVTTKLNYSVFAITNTTSGTAVTIQTGGVVGGFTGLTVGVKYYVQDAVGTIGTTPGTYEILVGIAISATQILMIREDQLAFIDSNVTRTDTQTAAAAKNGTFVINTQRRAKLIEFFISVFSDLQTGANSTGIKTYHCFMDLINQRICAKLIYSTAAGNQTSPSIYTTGAANLSDMLLQDVAAMSNSIISVSAGGTPTISRIDTIVSTENAITFSYTLNTAAQTYDCGIALSSVIVHA